MTNYNRTKADDIREVADILQSQLQALKTLNDDKLLKGKVEKYIINPLDCIVETWDKYGYDLNQWAEEVEEEEDETDE
jgi:hypothetical protein